METIFYCTPADLLSLFQEIERTIPLTYAPPLWKPPPDQSHRQPPPGPPPLLSRSPRLLPSLPRHAALRRLYPR